MAARITPAQARALGIDVPAARAGKNRRVAPTRGQYATRCAACGETFDTQAGETRHMVTGHRRYEIVLTQAETPRARRPRAPALKVE